MKKKLLILLLVVVVAIQLIPVDRNNPPVTRDVGADAAAAAVLRRSCYDCHSNETVWPWYGYVAPVSWLVNGDVEHAREHLNFSEWDQYDEKRIRKIKEEIIEEVDNENMPLKIYLVMHRDANLSDADFQAIKSWAENDAEKIDDSSDHAENHK
jgi:hypothetical protein